MHFIMSIMQQVFNGSCRIFVMLSMLCFALYASDYEDIDKRIELARTSSNASAELRLLRNEMYARNGREFQADDLRRYFSKKPWYIVNKSYSDKDLSAEDKKRVALIESIERSLAAKKTAQQGGSANAGFNHTGTSSIEFSGTKDHYSATIKTQEYKLAFVGTPQKKSLVKIIISERKESEYSNRTEGSNSELNATAFLMQDSGSAREIWTIDDSADLSVVDKFYHTFLYGCCGSRNLGRCYNLKTGRMVLEHSGDLMTIEFQGSGENRYIGFKATDVLRTEKYENEKMFIGSLVLTNDSSVIQKIALYAKDPAEGEDRFDFGRGIVKICSMSGEGQTSPDSTGIVFPPGVQMRTLTDDKSIVVMLNYFASTGEKIPIAVKDDRFDLSTLEKMGIRGVNVH